MTFPKMSRTSLLSAKTTLRAELKKLLLCLNKEIIQLQSKNVAKQIYDCPAYKNSIRIGIYLSMPEEVSTDELLYNIFKDGKECFIPRFNKLEMSMVKLSSYKDYENLPIIMWNIKQPSHSDEREDSVSKGGLDLILCPGLGFTRNGARLGRGKGYYDSFLIKNKITRQRFNLPPTILAGLALTEQILEEIPVDEHDINMDKVFYPR